MTVRAFVDSAVDLTGEPATLTVVAEEPNVGGGTVGGLASGAHLAAFPSTNWGLSEY